MGIAVRIHKEEAGMADWPRRGGFLGGTALTVGAVAFNTGGIRKDGLIRDDRR